MSGAGRIIQPGGSPSGRVESRMAEMAVVLLSCRQEGGMMLIVCTVILSSVK